MSGGSMTTGEKVFQLFALALITVLCLSMIYPFLHLLAVSFSTPTEALRPGIHIYPQEFSFAAYDQAFRSSGIWIGYGNTIFRTLFGTFLSLAVMTLGAYALSKTYLPHRQFYTLFIVITMFFSGGLIPSFLLVKSLGLYDTRWALIIPGLINTFYMLIMRNFLMAIPSELEDSARLDGANDIRILYSIVLPLSKPILATVSLWVAVHHWNEWFQALIYIQSPSKILLQIYLRRLIVDNDNAEMQRLMDEMAGEEVIAETVKAAVLMIGTVPILLVYPFIQKHFVNGIMVGSLKG
jgi:putative aldouronate transport system permease protein